MRTLQLSALLCKKTSRFDEAFSLYQTVYQDAVSEENRDRNALHPSFAQLLEEFGDLHRKIGNFTEALR